MSRVAVCAALGLCIVVTAVFGEEVREALVDGIAAYVNEHVITVGEVRAAAQPLMRKLYETTPRAELKEKLKEAYGKALESMIEHYLILDAFEKRQGKIPDWVIEQRVDDIVRDRFSGDRLALMQELSHDGLLYADWRADIRDHYVVQSMRRANVYQHLNVSPTDVRQYYNKNIDRYMRPDKVHLRMIVLPADKAAEQLVTVKQRLDSGEAFADVAKALSTDRKAEDGGDWGWMTINDLRFELADAVRLAHKRNETYHVVELPEQGGTYVFKIEDWESGGAIPFEDVQQKIESELRDSEETRLSNAWVARMKANAYIRICDVDPF